MLKLKKNVIKYKSEDGSMLDASAIVGQEVTDSTLTKAGTAADAKVVGDKFAEIHQSKADQTAIPTKTSQLQNDSNFVTKDVTDALGEEIENKVSSIASSLENYYLKSEADILHTELHDYVDTEVAALVNAAPETLDTLGELAQAFNENKEVVEALDASITNKQDKVSDALILVDTVTGIQHKIQIQNGQLVSFPVTE